MNTTKNRINTYFQNTIKTLSFHDFNYYFNNKIILSAVVLLITAQINSQVLVGKYALNTSVQTIVSDTSGNVYLGGNFTNVGIYSGYGAKFNNSGILDTLYSKVHGSISAIVAIPGGGWYIGGDFTSIDSANIKVTRNRLARINSDGSLHPFNPNLTNGSVNTLALDALGNLYAGGTFTSLDSAGTNKTRNRFAKFNSSGTLSSFNPNMDNKVYTIALDASNNLYIGGAFSTVDSAGSVVARGSLAKYSSSGILSSFNPKFNNTVEAIAIDNSNNLYVGGRFSLADSAGTGTKTRNYLAKYSSSGILSSFNPNFNNIVYALTIDNSSNLYVGGDFTKVDSAGTPNITRKYFAKYSSSGILSSFNPNFNSIVYALAFDNSSNLYVGGYFTSVDSAGTSTTRNRLAKFSSTGVLTNFNPNMNNTVSDISIDASGNLYVGGSFYSLESFNRNRLAKFDKNGNLTSFNPNINTNVNSLALDASGNLYVGGAFTTVDSAGTSITRNRIAKYSSSGILSSFNPNMNNTVNVLAVDASGNLYAGGIFTTVDSAGTSTNRKYFAKYSSSGILSSFNPNMNNNVIALTFDIFGNLYIGGQFTKLDSAGTTLFRNGFAKYNSSGILSSFNPKLNKTVNSIALDVSNNLYIGGSFTTVDSAGVPTTRRNFAKFNSSGILSSFNPDLDNRITTIALDKSSNLYVGGTFTEVDSLGTIITRNRFAKFDSSGILSSFNPNYSNTVNSIAIDKSEKIHVGGNFTFNYNVYQNVNEVYSVKKDTICQNSPYFYNNVNLTTSGIYKDTFLSSRNIDSIETLTLTVIPASSSARTQTICQGKTYLYNGVHLTTAGTYKDTFVNAKGCDSVETLTLVVNLPSTSARTHTICQGNSYTYNGVDISTAGTYKDTFVNAKGCDSIETLTLVVNLKSSSSRTYTICQGKTYLYNGVHLTTAGIYKDTFVNAVGCDSFEILNLVVNLTSTSSRTHTICQGKTYLYNGVDVTTAGTYKDTFVNAKGCDSIETLTLVVNPISTSARTYTICQGSIYTYNGMNLTTAGTYNDTFVNAKGCDSVETLTLVVNLPSTSARTQTICQGKTYLYNGVNLTMAGTYKDTFVNAKGCDSVETLTLVVNLPSTSARTHTICQGNSYTYNGVDISTAGTYKDTFVNAKGCDSVETLTLVVNLKSSSSRTYTICQGKTYLYNGVHLTTAGIYKDTFVNAVGCDSFEILNLVVNLTSTSARTYTICQGSIYTYNGMNLTTAGTYKDTFVNAKGCDSIETLTLVVNLPSTSARTYTICQGKTYLYNGVNLKNAGTYKDTFVNAKGCDSVETLTLVVNLPSISARTQTICQGSIYIYNGMNLTTAGTYKDTFVNAKGCDSVETLTLVVNLPSTSSRTYTICQGKTYLYNGVHLTTAGTYKDTFVNAKGCDSVETLTLVVNLTSTSSRSYTICQGKTYLYNGVDLATAGTYKDTFVNAKGCDSIETLTLIVNPISTSSRTKKICSNQLYLYNGVFLKTAGNYQDTFVNAKGCDSIETLTLVVTAFVTSSRSVSICSNQSYSYNNMLLTTSGTYQDTFVSAAGCDSIETLTLTVKSVSTSARIQNICANQTYFYNGKKLTSNGIYKDTFVNSVGCDSIETVTLFVNSLFKTTKTKTICQYQNFVYNGNKLTASGIYYDTLASTTGGCDTIETLNLTVIPQFKDSVKITSINFYVWQNDTFYESSTYKNTYKNVNGCDSIYILNLTIKKVVVDSVKLEFCGNYRFNNKVYSLPGTYLDTIKGATDTILIITILNSLPSTVQIINGVLTADANNCTYQWYKCDGLNRSFINGAKSKTLKVSTSGNYAVEVKNDKCTIMSNCTYFKVGMGTSSINNLDNVSVTISPNPTKGLVNIKSDILLNLVQLEVSDNTGRIVLKKEFKNLNDEEIDMSSFANGLYFISVRIDNDNVKNFKIIKE